MRRTLLVLAAFAVMSAAFTYPLVLEMGSLLKDRGDPLLNSWALAWTSRALLTDPLSLFHANVFHPYQNTLAYSEHLVGSMPFALPAMVLSGNPVLAHNVVLLFSFVLAGFGMHCLVHHLTGNRFAGVVAGIIFAFCPFRFEHLGHLQLLTNHWMPFALLYLHRFFERERLRDALLFTLFFVLQALSCGYYAVFLGITVGIFILWSVSHVMRERPGPAGRLVAKLVLSVFLAGAAIYPFYRPYRTVNEEMSFQRPLEVVSKWSARPLNYLAAPRCNRVYGGWTARFGHGEMKLFPGLVAILLAGYGLRRLRVRRRTHHAGRPDRRGGPGPGRGRGGGAGRRRGERSM